MKHGNVREQMLEMENCIRDLRQQLSKSEARVAELESAYTSATTWEDVGDVFKKQSSIPWLLRKQAEAMERAIDSSYGFTQMAQRLRQQADELERPQLPNEGM